MLEEAVKNITKKNMIDNSDDRPQNVLSMGSAQVHLQIEVKQPAVFPIAAKSDAEGDYSAKLNTEQKRTHNMVTYHLDALLEGRKPP